MECFLHCCDNTHEPIPLPDGVDVAVGRMPELKIKNLKCSRKQVQLTADYKEKEVKVKQLGQKPSTIAGQELKQGQTSTLGPGGQICLLNNEYLHFVHFKILPMSPNKSNSLKDCLMNNSIDSNKEGKFHKKAREKNIDDFLESQSKNSNLKDHLDNISKNLKQKRKFEEIDEDDASCHKKARGSSTEFFNSLSKNSMNGSKSKKRDSEDKSEEICPLEKADHNNSIKIDAKFNKDNEKPVRTSCPSNTWDEIPGELLLFTRKGVEASSKIAGFDMDGTLITTKSGKVFPKDTGDWKILLPQIPGKLKSLLSQGYKIVIFTNQNGIAKKKVSVPDFKKKIENVTQALGVPVQVLISPGTGHFRKPSTGMWKHLYKKLNEGISIDKNKSFYIGDAAGRPAGWATGKKKDFSCSDRAFAANVGIKFQTPEEFFLDKKPVAYNMPEFDPKKLDPDVPLLMPSNSTLVSNQKEVIIMVGYPASGKSTFCEENLVRKGYMRVNRDSLGTWQKCVASCRTHLSQGKSVVVDNTNPDKDSRKRYIDCAKEAKVPVRCFIMNVTKDHAQHNNKIREALNTDKNYKPVGTMVYNTYRSSFVEPSTEEGFSEIVRVQFKPKFKNEDTKELYNQFL